MKILNLYAGIGGNRKLWKNHEITAIENNPNIVQVYSKLYPTDTIYCTDAHKYLEENHKKFDFIWSSPPCPSHGQYRHNVGVLGKGYKPIMPDMKLYAEIIFLSTYFKGNWVVENTKPYYEYLIKPSFTLQRHVFWSNFIVKEKKYSASNIRTKNKISDFEGYEVVANSKIKNKRQVLRNQINPEIGLYIIEQVLKELTNEND